MVTRQWVFSGVRMRPIFTDPPTHNSAQFIRNGQSATRHVLEWDKDKVLLVDPAHQAKPHVQQLQHLQRLLEVRSGMTESSSATAMTFVATATPKLPGFYTRSPELWLGGAGYEFRNCHPAITTETTKFDYLVKSLDKEMALRVTSLIADRTAEEPYTKLKDRLLRIFPLSDRVLFWNPSEWTGKVTNCQTPLNTICFSQDGSAKPLNPVPSRFINILMLGRPSRLYFDSRSTIIMGKTKQYLMVKSSSLSVYNLTSAMEAEWMQVLESFTNPGQKRKKPKDLP